MNGLLLDFHKTASDGGTHSPDAELLWTDLELQKILETMAQGDPVILEIAREVLLQPLTDAEEILQRQDVLRDCLAHPAAVKEVYQKLTDTLEEKKNSLWWLKSSLPSSRFCSAVEQLKGYHHCLRFLRSFVDQSEGAFQSAGFHRFFRQIQTQLDDDFLHQTEKLIRELDLQDGVLMELTLDHRQRAAGYHLVRKNTKNFRLHWAFAPGFSLTEQDETGAKDLQARNDMALWCSADLLSASAAYIENFLRILRRELAFYLGAVHLKKEMEKRHIPCCFPVVEANPGDRSFRDLQDLSLALRIDRCVGNDLQAAGKLLYVVTGANQGGKTTFLRSLGQAQVLAQCGLFVAAEEYTTHISQGVFTHFNREEDEKLRSGKLDEELQRLDTLISQMKPGSLLLCNESLSSTNEREGSEICRQITMALLEHQIEQVHVTHLYTFAHQLEKEKRRDILFLKSERSEDGSRSFRICPGAPEQTAFGEDLYRKVWRC